MTEHPAPGSGWFPDPAGRYDLRWYNGTEWTGDVSVDGQRYVDPVPAWQASLPSGAGVPSRPGQTLAILALVAGLVGAATAWMPLVVAVGGPCAVLGVVLGAVALRRIADGRAAGRGMAVAGLVVGLVGLALVPVGVLLTQRVIDEVIRFAEPGRLEAEIESCLGVDGRIEVSGTVRNLDDTVHDYVVFVDASDVRGRDGSLLVEVTGVAPGEQRRWTSSERSQLAGELRCSVEVTGPFPFGIRTEPPG